MYYLFQDYFNIDTNDVFAYGITTNNTFQAGPKQSPIWCYRDKNPEWVTILQEKARYYAKPIKELKPTIKHKIVFQSMHYDEVMDVFQQHLDGLTKMGKKIAFFDYTKTTDEHTLEVVTSQLKPKSINKQEDNNEKNNLDFIKIINYCFLEADIELYNYHNFANWLDKHYDDLKREFDLGNVTLQDINSAISAKKPIEKNSKE